MVSKIACRQPATSSATSLSQHVGVLACNHSIGSSISGNAAVITTLATSRRARVSSLSPGRSRKSFFSPDAHPRRQSTPLRPLGRLGGLVCRPKTGSRSPPHQSARLLPVKVLLARFSAKGRVIGPAGRRAFGTAAIWSVPCSRFTASKTICVRFGTRDTKKNLILWYASWYAVLAVFVGLSSLSPPCTYKICHWYHFRHAPGSGDLRREKQERRGD